MAEAVRKCSRVVPDERLVAEHVQDEREVGDRDDAGGLRPAPVVVTVRAIQRDREEAAGMPLKGVPLARRGFGARAAPSGEDVDDFLVEMPLRRGLTACRDLDYLYVDEISYPAWLEEHVVCLAARSGRDRKGDED